MESDQSSKLPLALVVDDEPLIRMNTAEMVADEGFDVIEARSADEAFALLQEYPSLQLVFTDIQMPGKADGLDLARHVCERWPEVCVIVASGAVTPSADMLPETALFLGKPLSHELVHDTIRNFRADANGIQ
jgi:DNA-binding NtrC family response regulator